MSDPTTPALDLIPNRPTVEHMAGLFPKWGITPISHGYFDVNTRTCACLVGAMSVEAHGSVEKALSEEDRGRHPRVAVNRLTGLPDDYTWGLVIGFASLCPEQEFNPILHAGWSDGRAVRDLVLPTTKPSTTTQEI